MGALGLDNGKSTKYLTEYSNNTIQNREDFTVGKVSVVGDGIKEVHVTTWYGWYSDASTFVYSTSPFSYQGGQWGSNTQGGVFAASCSSRI